MRLAGLPCCLQLCALDARTHQRGVRGGADTRGRRARPPCRPFRAPHQQLDRMLEARLKQVCTRRPPGAARASVRRVFATQRPATSRAGVAQLLLRRRRCALQGKLLKMIVEATKDLVTDANLNCTSTGITLQVRRRGASTSPPAPSRRLATRPTSSAPPPPRCRPWTRHTSPSSPWR